MSKAIVFQMKKGDNVDDVLNILQSLDKDFSINVTAGTLTALLVAINNSIKSKL